MDLVLTDPPYSSGGLYAGDRKQSTGVKYTNAKAGGKTRFQDFSGDNMDQRSFTEFMRMIFFHLRMKTKDGGVCASFIDWRNLPAMTDALQAAGWIWRGVAVWDKIASRPQKGRFRNQCEYIVWGSNGKLPFERGVPPLKGVFTHSNVATQRRHHQTEKPVELLEEILQIVPEGAKVIDPFMGSGSTGVACVNTGRQFIGIELDDKYFEIAQQRINNAVFSLHK